MNNNFDALEACLQAIEQGADLEAVLARYPDLAEELRPILEASIQARRMAASDPSPEVMQRGRARLLQHAAEMREARTPASRRMIPRFQRFALAFILSALFLLSGTGLVRASSTALPGENLYPVKRTWEGMRLFLVFDEEMRENLELEYENERLEEVNELLTEGRDEIIRFAGIWLDVNGVYYASGIRVEILDTTKLPAEVLQNGAAVIVSGYTNASGYVEAEMIDLLPAGTNVPAGLPVEVESETEEHTAPDTGSISDDQNDNADEHSNENSNESHNNDNGDDNHNENGDESKDNNDNKSDDNSNEDNSSEDNSGHDGDDESSSGDDHSGDEEENSNSGDEH
jgi:hypothetical protein